MNKSNNVESAVEINRSFLEDFYAAKGTNISWVKKLRELRGKLNLQFESFSVPQLVERMLSILDTCNDPRIQAKIFETISGVAMLGMKFSFLAHFLI